MLRCRKASGYQTPVRSVWCTGRRRSNSVALSACMAAALTALVIILFLGNMRLSLIILAAIPLSIIAASGKAVHLPDRTNAEHHDAGRIFALAIGMTWYSRVTTALVVIENIERHASPWTEPLYQSIVVGAGEVGLPTFLSTLCICIVFVPVFLLQGNGEVLLFAPLSLSVIGAPAREPRAVVHHGPWCCSTC